MCSSLVNSLSTINFLILCYIRLSVEENFDGMDILQPYSSHHGPKYRTHRQVRECQHVSYGNKTHSKPVAHGYHDKHLTLPIVHTRHFVKEVGTFYNKRDILVHMSVVNNPAKTVAVLEPGHPHSCQDGRADRATVMETAKQKSCIVAVNAGFFNTHNGACLGNIVADGRLVQDSGGIQNVNFGITEDGHLYFGYLSRINLVSENFLQLAGGVIWILRDGQVYLKESIKIECSDTEETGTVERFANVLSARTVVGNNKEGQLLILQVEGRTDHRGINLYDLAPILLEYGFVNAINFDGGGSATYVINGTLVNYPSDTCMDDNRFNCARNVSTVLCVYEPECNPPDCSGHGACILGRCNCIGYWSGQKCDMLKCKKDCSNHGICRSDGCDCVVGFYGDDCSIPCSAGKYGKNCGSYCTCLNGGVCNPADGSCTCKPGYTGKFCQKLCPAGYYGAKCKNLCLCNVGCPCHPVTGSCNFTDLDPILREAGSCYAKKVIKAQHLVPDKSEEYRMIQISLICLSIVAAISMVFNVILLYKVFTKKHSKRHRKYKRLPVSKPKQKTFKRISSSDELSSFSDYPMKETSFNSVNRNNSAEDIKTPLVDSRS